VRVGVCGEDACVGDAGSEGDETGSRVARTVLGWDEPFREIAHSFAQQREMFILISTLST
jgi:hypothetical protein